MASSRKKAAPPAHSHMTKKCPECFAYLRLDATVCQSCGKSVGPVTPVGLAQKVVDVKAYLVALGAVIAFGVFVWWGFFTD